MLPTTVPRRDPILTAFALEYQNPAFVGDSLGPMLTSDTRTIEYGLLDKLNLFQNLDDNLAKNGEANEVGFGAELLTARMKNWALKTTISREDEKDADTRFLNLAMDQVSVMSASLALSREYRQSQKILAALVAASRQSDPGNWADRSASYVDIVDQVRTKTNEGLYSYDSAVCPKQVLFAMERHPSLVSQWFDGNSGKKILSTEQIKEVLGLTNLYVPDGRFTTTRRPGKVAAATPIDGSLTRIWGNHFILFRKATGAPNRMAPGLFYQFRRTWGGGNSDNRQVRTWHLPQIGMHGADVVQEEYQSLDLVFPEMGWAFQNVLT